MSQRSPFNKRNMPKSAEPEAKADDERPASSGMARRSAASAKPARAAAQSVRVVSAKKGSKASGSSRANMTKEEKKAARRAEREEEDLIASVSNMLMKQDPLYTSRRRVWWVLLGVGLAFVVVCFAASYLATGSSSVAYDLTTATGVVSLGSLVAAYAFIIAAFVYEFVRIRPIRNEAMASVRGMSDKRRRAVIEAGYEEEERRRAEKAARKAGK